MKAGFLWRRADMARQGTLVLGSAGVSNFSGSGLWGYLYLFSTQPWGDEGRGAIAKG